MNFEEEISFQCPFCGEPQTLPIEPSAGDKQEFTYDCEVCCHPIAIKLEANEERGISFTVEKES